MTIRQGIKKPDITSALEFWRSSFEKKYSPLVELLFFLRRKAVVCSQCKNESVSWETLNITKLCVKNDSTDLLELMKDDCKGEEIDEYQCAKCSPESPVKDSPKPKRYPGSIQRRFWRLPQNLNIMLKRFNWNGSKCNANFTTEQTQAFTPWFSDNSPEVSKTANYTVHSIVDHHGAAGGGHYVAQVKSPSTGKWNLYDDQSVGTIGDGDKPFFGKSNYILFFRRS
jgi:ubiquitin C-terminal hydrolase